MTEPVRTFVKWTVALVVLAGIVAYALSNLGPAISEGLVFADDEEEGGSADLPSGPVTDGQAEPVTDLTATNGVALGVGAPAMTIGQAGGDAALLAFPLIDGSPDCVASVRVEVSVAAAAPPTLLGAYPSNVFDAPALVDNGAVPADVLLDRNGVPTDTADGPPERMSFDVTQIYRSWASQQAFASGAIVPQDTPFTVAISPADAGVPGRAVTLESREGVNRPALVWTGTPGCGGEAPASETPASDAPAR